MKDIQLNGGFKNTHIMHHINWELVPESAKEDLIQIYRDFKKHYKPSFPTPESLKKAITLLKNQHSDKLTDTEKTALKNMRRIFCIKSLYTDAANEYRDAMCKAFGAPKLDIDVKLWSSAQDVIFLDHMLRHPCKMATIQKLSRLRCKARRAKRASSNEIEDGNVGF